MEKRPPAKRHVQDATNGSSKRSKNHHHLHQQQPLSVPPGSVLFRLLCNASRIGGVIGKSGASIKLLQQSTSSKIRVEDAPPDCTDRVITVIASSGIKAEKLSLFVDSSRNEGVRGVEVDVSAAQEALIRVFEKILEVAAEEKGAGVTKDSVVTVRLLAERNQAGSVIGKGGKVVKKIREECGCTIRVLSAESLSCAAPTDEVIEIDGSVLDVKRALIAVTRQLQDNQPVDKSNVTKSRDLEAAPLPPNFLIDGKVDFMHRIVVPPSSNSSMSYSSGRYPLSIEAERVPNFDSKTTMEEVKFRILCSNDRVGGIIGKGGAIIKALNLETGASISIGASLSDCDERLITITAMENMDSRFSPAQKAIIQVFNRSVEAGMEKGLGTDLVGTPIVTRLVVQSNQIGCLLGKGGTIITEIRKRTGAGISILGTEEVPKCALEDDRIVQISGVFSNVQDALCHVTGKLREKLLPSKTVNGDGNRVGSSSVTDISPYREVREPVSFGARVPVDISHLRSRDIGLTYDLDRRNAGNRMDLDISHLRNRNTGLTHDLDRRDPGNRMDSDISYFHNRSTGLTHDLDRHDAGNRMDSYLVSDPVPYHDARDPISFGGHASNDISHFRHRNNSLRHSLDRHDAGNRIGSSLVTDLSPYHEVRDPMSFGAHASFASSHLHNRSTGLPQTLDRYEQTHNLDQPISLKLWEPQKITGVNSRSISDAGRGFTSFRGGSELGSGSRTALVTNTTVEIVVPDNVIGSVYGENGSNLARLRQISGAKVTVLEPHPGTRDRIVVISGTPEETQAAQSLLHAFILTGSSGID